MGFLAALAPFLPAIGAGIQTIATVGQTIGGVRSAEATAKQAREVARIESAEAAEDAAREAELRRIELRRLLGTQRVRAAAGGIAPGVGSPLDIELETLRMGRQELEDIFLTGRRKVRAAQLTGRARVLEAKTAKRSTLFKGLGQLGSIATGFAKSKS